MTSIRIIAAQKECRRLITLIVPFVLARCRNDARGSSADAEALPLWDDLAVLRRTHQLDRLGGKLHGSVSVCWRRVHHRRRVPHMHGDVLLAPRAQPERGRRIRGEEIVSMLRAVGERENALFNESKTRKAAGSMLQRSLGEELCISTSSFTRFECQKGCDRAWKPVARRKQSPPVPRAIVRFLSAQLR